MKTTLLWLLLLATTLPLFGTPLSLDGYEHFVWNRGEVTLTDKSVVRGLIGYDHTQGVVMVKTQQGIKKAFSPRKVRYFTFYDEILSVERLYVSLSTRQGTLGASPLHFFEVVMDGSIAVLRKEKKYANIRMALTTGNRSNEFTRHAACFDYYAYQDGKFYGLAQFQEVLYPQLLQQNKTAIEALVAEKELDLRYLSCQITVINFYNQLLEEHKEKQQLAAQ